MDTQHHLLRAILESPPDVVIFALDRGYRYLAFNDAHRRTIQSIWHADISVGQNMLEVIGRDDDRAKARHNFDRALDGEHFTLVEEYGADHNRRYYRDVYSPIVDEEGRVIGLTVFLTDITEHKRTHDQLAAYRKELEQLVEERTAAVEMRDELLRFVAHDLRSPLTTIQLGIDVMALELARDPSDAKLVLQANAIARAAQRAEHMIRDLLDVATDQSTSLVLQRAPLRVRDLVREVVEAKRPIARANELDLDIAVERDLPDVLADRERIMRVLENLIGNAIKFTRKGGKITIGAERHQEMIAFRVADTGSGIAHDDLDRIFDAYWQAGADFRGLGLGLAICKRFVEAHGGTIWAESEVGVGTTITFVIPLGATTADDRDAPAPPPGA